MNKSIFLNDFNKYGILITDGWIKSVWRFCTYYNLQLHLPTIHHLITPIMNDQPIMRIAIDSNLFNNKSIQLINLVHLNLQIIFLSDLLEIGMNKVK